MGAKIVQILQSAKLLNKYSAFRDYKIMNRGFGALNFSLYLCSIFVMSL